MKEQEAVERLKCMRLFMQINDDSNDSKFLEDDYIANDMAIKALEKQVAKKPIVKGEFGSYKIYRCPCCMEELYEDTEWGTVFFEHCTECGQKLDWSDEE